jgi:hypothetical protein
VSFIGELDAKVVPEQIRIVTWFKAGTEAVGAHDVGSRFDAWVCIGSIKTILYIDDVVRCHVTRSWRVRCNEWWDAAVVDGVVVE